MEESPEQDFDTVHTAHKKLNETWLRFYTS